MKQFTTQLGLSLVFYFILASATGQAPQRINYQAVARNTATGLELVDQNLFVVAIVRAQSPTGTIVYQENHADVHTNSFGLFGLGIGGGDPITGSFAAIDWAASTYWLEIELDFGQGLQTIGTMQFLSVPYALHAETVTNADDADADPTNEQLTQAILSTNNILELTESGQNFNVDLSPLINDADADPTNEVVTSFALQSDGQTLNLSEAGQTFSVDLSPLANDADADPNNELISAVQLIGTNLVITENQNWSVSLAQLIDDADANPSNELIESGGLTLVDDSILTITEGGLTHSLNLGPLSRDDDWIKAATGNKVYNLTDRIGIGTNNPSAKLDVVSNSSSETLLRVKGSNTEPTLFVKNGATGIGTASPQSSLDVKGSIGLQTNVITNAVSSYSISNTDCNIAVKIINGGLNSLSFVFPLATTCPGRVVNIYKRGTPPLICEFIFNLNGEQLNFQPSNLNPYVDFTNADYQFLSLGADGWLLLE